MAPSHPSSNAPVQRAPRGVVAFRVAMGAACIAAAPLVSHARPTTDVPPVPLLVDAAAPSASSTETASLARTRPTEQLPLGRSASRGGDDAPASTGGSSLGWWVRTGSALAVVLTLIFALRLMMQKMGKRSGTIAASLGAGGRAPSGVLEVIGRYPVSRGHSLVLLRCDRRVLLLGQSASGFRTLAELTDADDVASILTKTRDDEGATLSSKFSEIIRSLERDPATIADERPTGPTPIVRAGDAPREAARDVPREAPRPMTPQDPVEALRRRLAGIKGVQA